MKEQADNCTPLKNDVIEIYRVCYDYNMKILFSFRQANSEEFRVENVLAEISVALTSIAQATCATPEELDYEALNGGINRM